MQLIKIELRGFKSFADKTTLVFDKGITAIVGPNGSGKSNISDAVRWVMGEQNIRQLRGQKSEDIIFSGTEKRRPQGAAEVSLYFDNTDQTLSIDFAEVVVTRRIFRSGDSEYYINKRPCRLKDVHQLFADTGIGQDSMAVIGQNRVDRILNSKPDERRVIFEEVAGISRYKGRKQEGLRKISDTDRNLERIHDMMAVLEEQLSPMEKQAKRTQEFNRLEAERIAYEGTLALQELRNAERQLEKVENSRMSSVEAYEKISRQLEEDQQKRQILRNNMEKEEENWHRLGEETLEARNGLNSLKSRKEAFEQRCRELQEETERLAGDGEDLQNKREEIRQKKQSLETKQEMKEKEAGAAKSADTLSQVLFHKADRSVREKETALQELQACRTKQEQDLFVLRQEIQNREKNLQEDANQIAAMETERARLRQNSWQLEQQHLEANTACAAAQQVLEAANEEVGRLRQQRNEAEKAVNEAQKDCLSLHSEGAGLSQRVQVLESMEQEHEGVNRAAKEILQARQSWRGSICGVVGELCTIPTAYAIALDIALGGAAQFVVTDHEKAAKEAIMYLKQRHSGRATFLPLDTIREKHHTAEEERASGEPGILGFANALLTYEPKYSRIFSSLLGKTLIAESMETGAAIAKKYGYRLRLVCLDGTQFNVGGSLTGGSNKAREGSLVSRRALLEQLKQQWTMCRGREEEAAALQSRQEAVLTECEKTLKEQEEHRQQVLLTQQQSQWDFDVICRKEKQIAHDNENCVSRLQELKHQTVTIQKELVEKKAAIQHTGVDSDEDEQILRQACDDAIAERERCRKSMTEQQVLAAQLQEQLRYVQDQLVSMDNWYRQTEEEQQQLEQRQQTASNRLCETEQMLQELTARIEHKAKEVQEKDKAKNDLSRNRTTHVKDSQNLERHIVAGQGQQGLWQQKINAADVQMEKYRSDMRHCEELLTAQGLTRQQAMAGRRTGTLKELNDQVALLRRRISTLGQVNPNAVAEYEEAQEKRNFFHRQCDDLLEARKRLEKIVSEIDDAMSVQFEEAFKEISRHFQVIFNRLFGGGQAVLCLSDPKNILTAGVDIYIQPPGKKQQQLSLLSGGERALTVIALLFSFLAYHPAPFCLLDEVDAALDEANVERLGSYLQNYSGDTQFIVITHRRKTMEAANLLQGVTMEEKGVSRLLTVRVDELLEEGT